MNNMKNGTPYLGNAKKLDSFSIGYRIIAILSFTGSLIWFGMNPNFEPAVTSLATLGTLIALFIEKNHKIKKCISNCDMLSGEISIEGYKGKVFEVFYRQPFIRTPYLELKQLSRFTTFELIEQRLDGFKIKTDSTALSLKWKAMGEFAKR